MNNPMSDAMIRTHLANERTHLALLRTSLSLLSFGITINRFSIYLMESSEHEHRLGISALQDAESMGIGMVLLGLLLLIWSLYRYRKVTRLITKMNFEPAGVAMTILTIGTILFGAFVSIRMILGGNIF